MKKFFKLKNPVVYLCFIYLFIGVLWINIIPFNNTSGDCKAPDEWVHYGYNVKFLIENKRLPISGQDDLDLIKSGRENLLGKVQAIYSYNIYPQFNYIVSAFFAVILHYFFKINYEIGSRYAGIFWGIIYIIFLYHIISSIEKNKYKATIITACFCFVPQIIFISSYTNQDIHSLAISSILVYTFMKLSSEINNESLNKITIIKFALACALLLVSKLNYIIYIPFIGSYLIWLCFLKKRMHLKQIFRMLITIIAIPMALSGFWYIRNKLLYNDFIGQKYLLNEMSKYTPFGAEQRFNIDTLIFFIKNSFFFSIFSSAIAGFENMNLWLNESIYFILLILTLISWIFISCNLIENKDFEMIRYQMILFLFILGTLLLIIVNSIKYDYQPQGRYMFPAVVPTAMFMAAYINKYPAFFKYMKITLSMVVFLLIMSTNLLIKTYATYELVPYKIEGVKQTEASMHIFNVMNEEVSQEFIANKQNLTEIDLNVATFKKEKQVGSINILLIENKSGKMVASQEYNLENVLDNSLLAFKFMPINDSLNKRYTILIKSYSSDINNKLTFYASNNDVFPEFDTRVNGKSLKQDIWFVSYYRPENYK